MKRKMAILETDVEVKQFNQELYISLTNMLDAKDGEYFVHDWLKNRNTLEFIGIWEKLNNPDFNYVEFDIIKSSAGLNRFRISAKEWVERTNAIGITSTPGRYGGTFAHPDIAFEFGMWVSPEFKVYLIKEFQRLKIQETAQLEWNAKRELAKINYRLQTDAIKENIVPMLKPHQATFAYTDEADRLNVALFGRTAKEWRAANPDKEGNERDHTTMHHNLVLANMESYNSEMIRQGIPADERTKSLNDMARYQLPALLKSTSPLLIGDKNPKL